VAIRITVRSEEAAQVLQVDGWLVAEDASEVQKAVDQAGTPAILDLVELRSADRASLEMLRGLLLRGIELRRASPSIRAQLEAGFLKRAIRRGERRRRDDG